MAAVAAMMMSYPIIRRRPRHSQKVRHLWQDATFTTISPMACESPRCVDSEQTTITATETNTNSITKHEYTHYAMLPLWSKVFH